MKLIGKYVLLCVLTTVFFCQSLTAAALMWIVSEENPLYEYCATEDGGIMFRVTETQNTYTGLMRIPATLDGKTVTSMAPFAYQMSGITADKLIVPDTVKSLGEYSLDMPMNDLYLPEGLETISYHIQLYAGEYLQDVLIPTTVTSIERYAFGWRAAADPDNPAATGSTQQIEGFTVYSHGNDVARDYAASEGYAYVDLCEYAYGDLDLNEELNTADALMLYRIAAGADYGSPVERAMGDYTGDSNLNMLDAVALFCTVSGR